MSFYLQEEMKKFPVVVNLASFRRTGGGKYHKKQNEIPSEDSSSVRQRGEERASWRLWMISLLVSENLCYFELCRNDASGKNSNS